MFSHFEEIRKPNGYWTKEKCQEEALKSNTKKEFMKNSVSAYNAAKKNGWLDEISQHFIELRKPNGYWTKEKCQEEALKYKTKIEFRTKNISAYDISYRNGWLDDICKHMKI